MNELDKVAQLQLPPETDESAFQEPWEAQAFAMAVSLHQQGLFSWDEWAAALSNELANNGDTHSYYQCWLATLENLVVEKNATTLDALKTREREWHAAAARTPHGEPIEL